MLYGRETWPVKEKDLIRLERNDARMIRWMCKIGLRKRFLQRNLRLNLNWRALKEVYRKKERNGLIILKEWKTLFGLEYVEPSRLAVVSPKGQSRKIWNKVLKSYLKERKVSQYLAKDRNAWKTFRQNSPTHPSMKNRC